MSGATLEWDRGTEPDLKEYRVWLCYVKDCVVNRTGNTVYATVPQTPLGTKPSTALPANTEGQATVDAGDQTGNRSSVGPRVPFSTIPLDITAPAPPTGIVTR